MKSSDPARPGPIGGAYSAPAELMVAWWCSGLGVGLVINRLRVLNTWVGDRLYYVICRRVNHLGM